MQSPGQTAARVELWELGGYAPSQFSKIFITYDGVFQCTLGNNGSIFKIKVKKKATSTGAMHHPTSTQ